MVIECLRVYLSRMNVSFARAAILLCALFSPLAALKAQTNYATPYTFATFAGLASGPGSIDGTGSTARFSHPASLAVDAAGNVYVADTNNNTVREITSGGLVTTFAGTAGSAGSTDGTGSAARFTSLNGSAVDGSGNVYVADTYNSTIRKITAAGVVTTLAGTAGSAGSTNATGSAARFNSPFAVAVDAAGNVYVADTYNSTIRKITAAGVVTTLAGTAGTFGAADGTGGAASFYYPTGIAVDAAGNVYVADTYNSTIRKITAAGVVTTFAGTAGSIGSTDGTGSAARFNFPFSLAVDSSGNLYLADTYNSTIRKITAAGAVTTLAGTAGSIGSTDGTGSAARFYSPAGVAVDSAGNVYISDSSNNTIRKITAAGVVTTFAGTSTYSSADGTGSAARFTFPFDVAATGAGIVYIADAGNNTIRKISAAGVVTTLAGTAGTAGTADGTGSAARFSSPDGVAVDGTGTVYVADTYNATIRKITPAGVVTTLAGTAGSTGTADGTGAAARFNSPHGLAADASGNVYVADAGNDTIRKISSAGVVTTLAGTAGTAGMADGTGGAARFNSPSGVALDAAGNVFVADAGNHAIRKISPAGVVTTLAGTAGSVGLADGTGSAARFNFPSGLTLDAAGNLFVADTHNDLIRKITPAGLVTTLAGAPGSSSSTDGAGSFAGFNYPYGVAVDAAGTLFVADTANNTVRIGLESIAGDFNGDGRPDLVWENTSTGDRYLWLMQNTTYISSVYLGNIPTQWQIVGTGDFNGDGQPDLVWENTSTGDRYIWLMNGTSFITGIYVANISTQWHIAAIADLNGDGQPDLVWENTVTGDRYVWLMQGTTYISSVYLGNIATTWHIVGAGDFDGDGHTDLVWENTSSGERYLWLMNGTTYLSSVDLGSVALSWHIAGTGDFNGDGQPDILWENTSTGDRFVWLMTGTSFSSGVSLGNVATQWQIRN
jgi:sugar lactone lactonase YvrE